MKALTENCVAHNIWNEVLGLRVNLESTRSEKHALFVIEGVVVMSAKAKVKYRVGKDVDLKKTVILDKSGKRLTDARAERIAREAIESVVGRPSLTGVAKISPEVKARVPEKLKIKLEKEAKRRGETTSSLIREALESFLSF